MSSQTFGATTLDPDRITFEVEQLTAREAGLIEVSGRWFGVRGRRFVRPTLIVGVHGGEVRSLAALEHKPWAAEDGELWTAAFPAEIDLEQAGEIELSVAPDIAVALRYRATGSVVADRTAAAPRPGVRRRAGAPRPVLTERAQQVERLTARLAAAERALEGERAGRVAAEQAREREHAGRAGGEQALERERSRRETAERALDDERVQSRRLHAELSQLRAKLDLAAAASEAAADVAAELRQAQAEARDAEREREREAADRAEERAQTEQLRRRLSRSPAPDQSRAETETARATPSPAAAPGFGPEADSNASSRLAAPPRRSAASRPGTRVPPSPARDEPRPDRPLNPSLRSRHRWLVRLVALLVMLGVIAAIVIVVRSTIAL